MGCAYPNVCYGPVHFGQPTPTGPWVVDMPASMANPDGPWVTRPARRGELSGFGESQAASGTGAALGLLLGVGVVLALVVVGAGGMGKR